MAIDTARFADQDIPANNRHFRIYGLLRDPFFRDDGARLEHVADAARRQADAINAERTTRLSLKAHEAAR